MSQKGIKVKNEGQMGGITAGVINLNNKEKSKDEGGRWGDPYFKYVFIPILVGVIILGLSLGADKIFNKKENMTQETYNVESHNQSGGITTGKIENLNIVTDKESLGIRDEFGIYKNGEMVAKVRNPVIIEEEGKIFFEEVYADAQISDLGYFSEPSEFRDYIITINSYGGSVLMFPFKADKVEANIIGRIKK